MVGSYGRKQIQVSQTALAWQSGKCFDHLGEGILFRQRGKLDLKYIRHWLKQFAEALEMPEMLTRFEELYEANR